MPGRTTLDRCGVPGTTFMPPCDILPNGEAMAEAADRITGHATPLLTYLERWKPDAGLKPRPLDQATSSIKQFDKAVGKPIERIEAKDVQRWIDDPHRR